MIVGFRAGAGAGAGAVAVVAVLLLATVVTAFSHDRGCGHVDALN